MLIATVSVIPVLTVQVRLPKPFLSEPDYTHYLGVDQGLTKERKRVYSTPSRFVQGGMRSRAVHP